MLMPFFDIGSLLERTHALHSLPFSENLAPEADDICVVVFARQPRPKGSLTRAALHWPDHSQRQRDGRDRHDNALRVVDLLGAATPVCDGCARPIVVDEEKKLYPGWSCSVCAS